MCCVRRMMLCGRRWKTAENGVPAARENSEDRVDETYLRTVQARAVRKRRTPNDKYIIFLTERKVKKLTK